MSDIGLKSPMEGLEVLGIGTTIARFQRCGTTDSLIDSLKMAVRGLLSLNANSEMIRAGMLSGPGAFRLLRCCNSQ